MIRRKLKNAVNKYTDAEVKVREATSNDPWGPSSTLMASIADLTYQHNSYSEVMGMLWRRLNDKTKNWRHIYKGLVLLEYIVKTGAPRVAEECQEYMHTLQMLHDFQCMEENKDHGLSVREKSKALVALLRDESLLESERSRALTAKERLSGPAPVGAVTGGGRKFGKGVKKGARAGGGVPPHEEQIQDPNIDDIKPRNEGEEDLQLQVALAMSKEEHEKEEQARKDSDAKEATKIRLAVQQSHEEEELALKASTAKKDETSTVDPFATSSAPPAAQNDPWSAGISSTPASNDPWAATPSSTYTSSDPWASVSLTTGTTTTGSTSVSGRVEPSSNGGGGAWLHSSVFAPPQPNSMGGPSSVSVPNSSAGGDPWASPPPCAPATAGVLEMPGSNGRQGTNLFASDDFEFIAARTQNSHNTAVDPLWGGDWAAGNNTTGSGGVVSPLSSTSPPLLASPSRKKSPDNFLGDNAGLVNLDTLIIKTKTPTNPFTGLPTTSFTTTNQHQPDRPRSTNPFATSVASTSLPLNQLAAESRGPVFSPPVSSSAYPSANNPWATTVSHHHHQPAASSVNPFL